MSRRPRLLEALVIFSVLASCTHARAPSEAPPTQIASWAPNAHADADADAAADPEEDDDATVDEMSGSDDGTGNDEDELVGVQASDEGESRDAQAPPGTPEIQYTVDLSNEQLERLWKDSPQALGSISIGFADEGRLINGERFPEGDSWIVVDPENTYATRETIDQVIDAIRVVRARFPDAPPLRVNQISAPGGGWLRPHKSHQSGRDVDLAFYYPTVEPVRARAREKFIDVAKTWALLKALITQTDVQKVLLDRRVQRTLYDHAAAIGEDRAWLDSVFNSPNALVKHARRHRDHLHVRFFNARAQELGRRVAPLLALRPEENLRMHRVRRGDTLGMIAQRYGSSVAMLRKVNGIKGSFLRLSQVLRVPLKGPCTRCPIPPPTVIPERNLPPSVVHPTSQSAALGTPG